MMPNRIVDQLKVAILNPSAVSNFKKYFVQPYLRLQLMELKQVY